MWQMNDDAQDARTRCFGAHAVLASAGVADDCTNCCDEFLSCIPPALLLLTVLRAAL